VAKILINGCSHSIPFLHESQNQHGHNAHVHQPKYTGKSWPEIFKEITDTEVISLAEGGKSNHWMIEELIRYIINDSSIDHIIIMLTELKRFNLYKRAKSNEWEIGNIKSQFSRLKNNGDLKYNSKFYVRFSIEEDDNSLDFAKSAAFKNFNDESLIHQIITTGTMLNALAMICSFKNIGLTIGNFDSIPLKFLNDTVWNSIPFNYFLSTNIENGLLDYFFNKDREKYKTNNSHLNQIANGEIAETIKAHYLYGDQMNISEPTKRYNFIYRYL
jgi:hypothetical protein